MLMTDLAVRDLEGRRDSFVDHCRRVLISMFGRSSDHHLPRAVTRRQPHTLRSIPSVQHPARQPMRVIASANSAGALSDTDKRWQRHPQLRSQQSVRASISGGERSARLEAERALILARGGKLAEAVEAFHTAAKDPAVDLSSLPGFWDMPRSSMMTAVRAYEQADRLRDAAALEARIRHLMRPRALRPVPSAARPSRMTASGD